MNRKELHKKIKIRKNLLNFLLIFMKRTNPLVVFISQNLDEFIQKEQMLIYKTQFKTNKSSKYTKVA